MRLCEIDDLRVTIELLPEDCAMLAAACGVAGDCADGSSTPTGETLDHLRATGGNEGALTAFAAMFEAAGMAASVHYELPPKRAVALSLAALRRQPVVWGGKVSPVATETEG